MKTSRVIIVGAGLAGVTTAYVLARRGHHVTLIESREDVALETSNAIACLLTPSMSDPWNAPGVHRQLAASFFNSQSPVRLRVSAIPSMFLWGLKFLNNSSTLRHRAATQASFVLANHSVHRTRALREQLGLECDAATSGAMKIFRTSSAMIRPLAVADMLAQLGLRFSVLTGDEAVGIEPELAMIGELIAGALYFPDDETGDALKFCRSLVHEIRRCGGTIMTGVRVLSVMSRGSRIFGVRTFKGVIEAETVVIAAGNGTASLIGPMGAVLSIKPVKGYTVTFNVAHMESRPKIPIIDDALHACVVPIGDRLRMAGIAEMAGTDDHLSTKRIENLHELLRSVYPHIAAKLATSSGVPWTGLRPMSSDGLPFVGPVGVAGLYVNAGHGHLGWTLAVGSAELVSDLIDGVEPAIDSAPYRADR